jgi:hypothetical protein
MRRCPPVDQVLHRFSDGTTVDDRYDIRENTANIPQKDKLIHEPHPTAG